VSKRIALSIVLLAAGGCSRLTNRPPAACDVLTADDIARTLHVAGVSKGNGPGFNSTTHLDTCRWTADGNVTLELRLFRPDATTGEAMQTVFESSKVYATRPDASGRVRARALTGVGDDAMVLADIGSGTSVAFRVGGTGVTLLGTAPEDALVELAKHAADRLR
jgi:hypothetical protein